MIARGFYQIQSEDDWNLLKPHQKDPRRKKENRLSEDRDRSYKIEIYNKKNKKEP